MGIGISFLVESLYMHTKFCHYCASQDIDPKVKHNTKYHICKICGAVGEHGEFHHKDCLKCTDDHKTEDHYHKLS